MTTSVENGLPAEDDFPRPDATDVPCPACGAPVNVPCTIRLAGVDTTGWSHDDRILFPVYEALRAHPIPPVDAEPCEDCEQGVVCDEHRPSPLADEPHERGAETLDEVDPAVAERYGLAEPREENCSSCGHRRHRGRCSMGGWSCGCGRF